MKNIVDYILLILYTLCLDTLWQLCRFGGVRSHLRRLLPMVVLLLIFTAMKLVLRHKGIRASHPRACVRSFAAITVVFSGLIIYAAIPYHGQLSWKLQDLLHHKKIEFTHDQLYTDGVEGILEDISTKLTLPEKLYITNSFSADFTADGTITRLDTMLYGENAKGETETYLISYDATHGSKLDIWTKGAAETSYDSAMLWDPLPDILSKSDIEATVRSWETLDANARYEILYYGKRSFRSKEGLRFIEGDADGDGIEGTDDAMYQLGAGGEVSGYEVSLYMPDYKEITPVRYIMEPEFIPQSTLDAEHEDEIVASAKDADGWTVDRNDGSVYTFTSFDANAGYRLVVTDAAAGSRFYALEKTTDGGTIWERINDDPFGGSIGVAEGIEFFTEDFGFIGLQSASADYSRIFRTEDGGRSFTEIELPTEEITEVPEPGKSYGLTLENYQYLTMPTDDGTTLSLMLTPGAAENDSIRFCSEDQGKSWHIAQ